MSAYEQKSCKAKRKKRKNKRKSKIKTKFYFSIPLTFYSLPIVPIRMKNFHFVVLIILNRKYPNNYAYFQTIHFKT